MKIIKDIKRKRRFNSKVSRVLADYLAISENSFSHDTKLLEIIKSNGLTVDELDIIAFITELESTLNIQIPDEIIEDFKEVGDLYDYINKTLNGGKRY